MRTLRWHCIFVAGLRLCKQLSSWWVQEICSNFTVTQTKWFELTGAWRKQGLS